MDQNPAVSKALLEKKLKSLMKYINLYLENYCIPRRHKLLSQTFKQPLRNFEPQKRTLKI